jgi:hypothetical protein
VPREIILHGLRIVVPLAPEAQDRIRRVWSGMKALESQLPRAGLFMSPKDRTAIADALKVIVETCEDLLLASGVSAAPSSPTPKK